jgi:Na+/H+-dicarboxylate symporter
MTRAARFALEGHLAEATHVHPLWMVVLPLVTVGFALEVVGYARTGKWGLAVEARAFRYAITATFAALLVLWLARFFGAFGGPAPI